MIDLDVIRQQVELASQKRRNNFTLSIDEAADLITRLRQAEKDAARYRWLRDVGCFEGSADDLFHATPAETDAEFDRFMQCEQ